MLCVVLYLDGFTSLFNYVKEQRAERRRQKEEEEQLKGENNNGNDNDKAAGKRKRSEMDTQKSNDDMSEDDLNFIPGGGGDGHPAVHEGGRKSRPGSQEAHNKALGLNRRHVVINKDWLH